MVVWFWFLLNKLKIESLLLGENIKWKNTQKEFNVLEQWVLHLPVSWHRFRRAHSCQVTQNKRPTHLNLFLKTIKSFDIWVEMQTFNNTVHTVLTLANVKVTLCKTLQEFWNWSCCVDRISIKKYSMPKHRSLHSAKSSRWTRENGRNEKKKKREIKNRKITA